MNLLKLAHSAKEIALSKIGVGVASKEEIERRRAICRTCPNARKSPTTGRPYLCELCECLLSEKTKRKKETCPENKW